MKRNTILIANNFKPIVESILTTIKHRYPYYEVEAYYNGEAVEKRLLENVDDVKLIILDNHMEPGKSGIKLIKKYALLEKFKDISFILHSLIDDSIGNMMVNKYGAFAYIPKGRIEGKFESILQEILK